MRNDHRRSKLLKQTQALMLMLAAVAFMIAAVGCSSTQEPGSGSDAGAEEVRPSEPNAVAAEPSQADQGATSAADPVDEPAPVSLPEVQIDSSVPTVEEKHPHLASAALVHARLMPLPDGLLMQADGLAITQAKVDAEIETAPAEIRDQLRKNAFLVLEQMASQELLIKEARQAGGTGSEEVLLRAHMQSLAKDVEVSDEDVADFYQNNRELIGGATLEQARAQIRRHLLQEKQQQMIEQYIRTLATRTPVAVAAGWVEAQARLVRDNSVDQARDSGKPTLVSFGADSCIPCQMMVPTREAVGKKYEGKANVVYVHVGNEQILAARYGVQGIPFLIFFDAEGRETHRHTGIMSQEQIEEQFGRMGLE